MDPVTIEPTVNNFEVYENLYESVHSLAIGESYTLTTPNSRCTYEVKMLPDGNYLKVESFTEHANLYFDFIEASNLRNRLANWASEVSSESNNQEQPLTGLND